MRLLSYVNLVDPILRNLRSSIPELCGMQKGQHVLDVCCGTGAQTFEYAKYGLKATGIDIDPAMIRLSARYTKHPANFDLILGDAEHMPFASSTFDFVSISLAIHDKNAEQQEAIIAEMKRIVKNTGKLVFIDYSHPLPDSWAGLAVRGIEMMAGGSHSHNFKSYSKAGGLKTIIERNALQPVNLFAGSNGLLAIMLCGAA